MKLYATITSERASKGQGGNEYLEIMIKDESGDEVARIDVSKGEEKTIIDAFYDPYLVSFEKDEFPQHKGEKQKGEMGKCTDCGQTPCKYLKK